MYDHYAILLYKLYLPEKIIAVNSLNGRKCDVILSYAPLQAFVFLALVLAVRWTSPDRPLQ